MTKRQTRGEHIGDLEAKLGRTLYREERQAVQRGEDILSRAVQLSKIQAKLGRALHRDERRAILRGEHILPSAVKGETWMARAAEGTRGKFKVVHGGAIESNRRKH